MSERFHLVGVGGNGMSGIARLLAAAGYTVSGSDARASARLERLHHEGIATYAGARAALPQNTDRVVVSSAIAADHPEVQAARAGGVPVWSRAQMVQELMAKQRAICVAGSHGKTTTAAMLAHVLRTAGKAPSFLLGADVPQLGDTNAFLGHGAHIVVEACEAFRGLDALSPSACIVTNVDDDHLEHYAGTADLRAAFVAFMNRVPHEGFVVACGDDPVLRALLGAVRSRVVTYGFGAANDFVVTEEDGRRFVARRGEALGELPLAVLGRHNVLDALGCLVSALELGVSFAHASAALGVFSGARRRFEHVASVAGVQVIDDYAHHPTEIAATLAVARGLAQRLVVAFQPQLYSRTRRLHEAFCRALAEADVVLVADVDPAGERALHGVSSRLIFEPLASAATDVVPTGSLADLATAATRLLRPGDLFLTLGAGAVDQVARNVAAALASPAPEPAGACLPACTEPEGTVTTLFEEQLARRPDAAAITDGARTLSYRGLDALVRRLAASLRRREVREGVVVGVELERSIESVAAFFAILRVGAVYLPLDPALPRERKDAMIADAGARCVLTRATLADDEGDADAGEAINGELAYVLYTSGSSGKPKGVRVPSRALANLTTAIIDAFAVQPTSRVAHCAALSFDVSLAEITMALCAGATLCVLGKPLLIGPEIAQLLDEQRITHLTATPSVLSAVPRADHPHLTHVISTGEPCTAEIVNAWSPGRRMLNAYGPTEATIYATVAECRAGEPITIGRPLANVHAAVLALGDPARTVGAGVIGELAISGLGLAAGYAGNEALTAERFIVREGQRWYRTGDLAYERADHSFVCLGRRDGQVKLRGVRIELGEIEAVLARHPAVAECVVSLLGEGSGRALVAYVVLRHAVDAAELRAFAQRSLPAAMLPAEVVRVDALPLTANGKRDYAALPALRRTRAFLAPASEDERTLAALWQRALHCEQPIGVDDDFFALGGSSLSAAVLLADVRRVFGVTSALPTLERVRTVRGMARALTLPSAIATPALRADLHDGLSRYTAGWSSTPTRPGSLVFGGVHSAAPTLFWCVQGERELQQLATELGSAANVRGMRSLHLVADNTPENVADLAAYYAEEIARASPGRSVVLGGNCQGAAVALATAWQLRELGSPAALLVLMELATPRLYPEPVVTLYGERSFLHPKQRGAPLLDALARSFPLHRAALTISGGHGEFFEPPHLASLGAAVRQALTLAS